MVVREVEVPDDLVVAAKEILQRSVIGNAGEQNESLCVKVSCISLREHGCCGVLCDLCEENILLPAIFSDTAAF